MKKLFTEPEIEILTFLCNTGTNDSYNLDGDNSEPGGDIDDILG